MGYYMHQRDQKFKIKAENKPAALEAIKNLAVNEKKISKICFGDSAHYAWVNDNFISRSCLEEALQDWRWVVDVAPQTKDIIAIYFDGEKLGDEEVLFDAIAPFVEKDSYIDMEGEESCIWKWHFTGNECIEEEAEIIWKQ